MATQSISQLYTVSDFLEWNKAGTLVLNPRFQRNNVWKPEASSYFIDTILRGLPSPKIFLRTKLDTKTMRSVREIVDGQQRLRAIIRFSEDKLVLTKRAGEFGGATYSTLAPDIQENFLSYSISTEQLINAEDSDVLGIFGRLNSYNVKLNEAELRHAEFQGEFKWSVRDAAQKWKILWERFQVVSLANRIRMQDDSLMAEMYGVILRGVTDGGQRSIRDLYQTYDNNFPEEDEVVTKLDNTLEFIVSELNLALRGRVSNAPHFLMLFAAVAHALHGIPQGELDSLPERSNTVLSNIDIAVQNVSKLSDIIEINDISRDNSFLDFWRASSTSTQRIASRKIRFPIYYRALQPQYI